MGKGKSMNTFHQAIVFGGTRGVGRSMVEMFRDHKIPVLFTGTDFFKTKQVEKELGGSKWVKGLPLQMQKTDSFSNFAEKVYNMGFQPNILVFNAGYLSLRRREKDENVTKLFQINAIAPILLTEHFLPLMRKKEYGHLIYTCPPHQIDDKVKYLTPYMQSKLAQTTYMKSMAHLLKNEPISCNSIWTKYPLWTDALRLRNIGSEKESVDPKIMVRVLEEIIFHENPLTFKGNELVDESYLHSKEIDPRIYHLGKETRDLDHLFMSHLLHSL